jgi:hypothetical protein
MKIDSPIARLALAVNDLRKADARSKQACERQTGKSWTRAALERDRCYDYARKLAADYFNLKD